MKSIVIIVATLLLLTAIQATSPSFATGTEPVIRVEPSTYIASSAGETFSINVTVTDAEDVNNWQISLLFAPSLLVVSDHEFGDFMRNAGIPTLQTFGDSSLIGHVYAAEAAAFDVVSGSGVLLRLNLTVLDSGYSSLHLYDTTLMDVNFGEIPHTTEDGMFILTSHPVDYNGDEIADFNVDITSNSTYLISFSFNDTGKYISFVVGGDHDTVGYSNVTIPKNLLDASTLSEWHVIVDDNATAFLASSSDTQTSIYLIYNHSLHTIRITGSAAIPEFPTAIISILIITGTVTIIMMRKAREFLKKTSNRSKLISQLTPCSPQPPCQASSNAHACKH
jgi:hypothetical protein